MHCSSQRCQQVVAQGGERRSYRGVASYGGCREEDDPTSGRGRVQAQELQGFIGDGRRVGLTPMLGQSENQFGGADRLEQAEGVEGVLLVESRLPVGLSEPFADLDDLGHQQSGRAGDGQVERAGIS